MAIAAVSEHADPQGRTRFDEICDELAELCGQQNAIAARITELLAEVDSGDMLGGTGLKSLEHFATWQLGVSPGRARNLTAIARRTDLPSMDALFRDGKLSEDQIAVVARRAPEGTDAHYAELAQVATVSQLRTALRAAPVPDEAEPPPPTDHEVTAFWDDDDQWVCRVRLSKVDGAVADAALRSHLDALVNEWKRERDDAEPGEFARPFPTLLDGFVRMVEHGLDAEAYLRPHGHRTTVVLHLDVESQVGSLHLGPGLSAAERRYLTCDARIETWFERDGVPIGVGRKTRELPRRLRRALEHRHRGTCCVPGCDARSGLHAHHLIHWEDGGETELENLVLVCAFHHREHHAGRLLIIGPASTLVVRDARKRVLAAAGLARPPCSSPPPAQYRHPTGERFRSYWYDPPSLC